MKSINSWIMALFFHGLVCMEFNAPRMQASVPIDKSHFIENKPAFMNYGKDPFEYEKGMSKFIPIEKGTMKLSVSSSDCCLKFRNDGTENIEYFLKNTKINKGQFTASKILPPGHTHQVVMDKVKLFLKNNSPDQLASVPKPADIRGRGGAGKASDLPSQARATKGAPKSSRKAGAKKGRK
ncbi:hypothetical protein Pst134EA_026794 [Puccinia striiformis f. sp. tritici]|uniref:hypothetical protein n=1 Tax=Puccinia striiformis f. sp. tritici TaxID=168172 RepID=UPI0020076450|nr:hypothetical protein Pst134EA_026794 [Puccinia striiformis f. sp. tritici]KAH9450083.1 hypothetical protein Pst134EA_026794 [Puccinia striiformis f. sp. tritici]KAI9626647.1 hypothetical protein KEM48_010273 [Puccinia striiformis f. sp. tritici PST-130]